VAGLHLADVEARHFARRPLVGDSGVFGGQPKASQTHGMQHIETASLINAPAHRRIAGVANVPDVQRADGYGSHSTRTHALQLRGGRTLSRHLYSFIPPILITT